MERWKYFWNLCLKIHSKKKIHPYGAQGFSRIDAIKLHVLPNLTDNFYPLKSLVHDNNHRSTVNKKVDLKHHHHFSYHKNSSNKKKEYLSVLFFQRQKKSLCLEFFLNLCVTMLSTTNFSIWHVFLQEGRGLESFKMISAIFALKMEKETHFSTQQNRKL